MLIKVKYICIIVFTKIYGKGTNQQKHEKISVDKIYSFDYRNVRSNFLDVCNYIHSTK